MDEEVTAEGLAGLLDVSQPTISQLAKRGLVVRGRRGRFKLRELLRTYCGHLREQASGRRDGVTKATERDRLARGDTTAIQRGALLDAGEVSREWEGLCRYVRVGVLRLPRRAGARLGLTPEQVRGLDDECRAVLTEMGSET